MNGSHRFFTMIGTRSTTTNNTRFGISIFPTVAVLLLWIFLVVVRLSDATVERYNYGVADDGGDGGAFFRMLKAGRNRGGKHHQHDEKEQQPAKQQQRSVANRKIGRKCRARCPVIISPDTLQECIDRCKSEEGHCCGNRYDLEFPDHDTGDRKMSCGE